MLTKFVSFDRLINHESEPHFSMAAIGVVLTMLFPSNAMGAVVDFEALAGTRHLIDTYSEDGFTLNQIGHSQFVSTLSSDSVWVGSTTLWNQGANTTSELVQSGGNPFSITSIDLSNMDQAFNFNVTFTGNFFGVEPSIEQTFNITTVGLETFSFDSRWVNLESVTWQLTSINYQWDNIVVNAVPLPAAVWLFLSALGGLVVAKRKQLNA